ncbi:uncharacterized protein LOC144591899 [Rhinoraja longicauda]
MEEGQRVGVRDLSPSSASVSESPTVRESGSPAMIIALVVVAAVLAVGRGRGGSPVLEEETSGEERLRSHPDLGARGKLINILCSSLRAAVSRRRSRSVGGERDKFAGFLLWGGGAGTVIVG